MWIEPFKFKETSLGKVNNMFDQTSTYAPYWAEEFYYHLHPEASRDEAVSCDEISWLTTWFAASIMAGYDAGIKKYESTLDYRIRHLYWRIKETIQRPFVGGRGKINICN